MDNITNSLAKPTQMRRDIKPRPRSEAKRAQIVEVAIRHFAERGYSAARVEDIAAQLGIAKGSVFQHFKSKDGLFFEAYKKAVQSFPKYMQAPPEAQTRAFLPSCATGSSAPRTWSATTGRPIESISWATTGPIWRCEGKSIVSS